MLAHHHVSRIAKTSWIAAFAIATSTVMPAFAIEYQWNGTTNSDWQTASNWAASSGQPASGGTAGSADTLTIANGAGNGLIYTHSEGTTTFDTLKISNGSLTITGGTLATTSTSSAVCTIGNNIGNTALTINGGNLTFYTDKDAVYLNNASNATQGAGSATTLNVLSGTVTFGHIFQMRSGAGTATVNLDGGTMVVSYFGAPVGSNNTFNFNGGTLKASITYGWSTSNSRDFRANIANVRDGGAIIDTNGKICDIGASLIHSTIAGDNSRDGGLTKNGSGTLNLNGINTYTGDTTVNTGTLNLNSGSELRFLIENDNTSNRVTGSGTVNFNGLFRIDASTLTDTSGTWQLVNINTLTEIFSTSTFGLVLQDGTTFTNLGGGLYAIDGWSFNTATGQLTLAAIPEPAALGLLACGMLAAFVRRSAA